MGFFSGDFDLSGTDDSGLSGLFGSGSQYSLAGGAQSSSDDGGLFGTINGSIASLGNLAGVVAGTYNAFKNPNSTQGAYDSRVRVDETGVAATQGTNGGGGMTTLLLGAAAVFALLFFTGKLKG